MNAGVDVDPILDPLREIQSQGYSRYNVFRDWIDLILYALQREDDPYLDILDDYDENRDYDRGNRSADHFSTAFGNLMELMEKTNQELLGVCYEEFGMQNDNFGQHFTPNSVSEMMAKIQTTTTVEDPDPPITIADPACGSGRLLVFAARHQDERTICFGQDKDLLCCEMTALNLCFFNIDGVVVCGDSLTVEKRRAWRTRSTGLGGEVAEVDPESVAWPEEAFKESSENAAESEEMVVETDGGDLDQSDLKGWLE
jgi:hypothetical protein